MNKRTLISAIDILAANFEKYDWIYHDFEYKKNTNIGFDWCGPVDEEIMVCVYKGTELREEFHRQNYFFFNYAYKGDYNALSGSEDNFITIKEGELCGGQPFTGYALRVNNKEDIIIVGILIQKDAFFKSFLPVVSENSKLMHFFLDPSKDRYSSEFIRLNPSTDSVIHSLLETMIVEYAFKKKDTQAILKPLTLALIMYMARQYTLENPKDTDNKNVNSIVQYISEHIDRVTLGDVANHFSYHPNYLSALLRKEVGSTFSQIVLKQRMERSEVLLENTNLTIEEVADMVGYSDSSNFYKAYRKYYRHSPRDRK